jgi:hypothetical protein
MILRRASPFVQPLSICLQHCYRLSCKKNIEEGGSRYATAGPYAGAQRSSTS